MTRNRSTSAKGSLSATAKQRRDIRAVAVEHAVQMYRADTPRDIADFLHDADKVAEFILTGKVPELRSAPILRAVPKDQSEGAA